MSNISIDKISELTSPLLQDLYDLELEVFEKPISKDIITSKLKGKTMLALIARQNGKAIGYKVGFEHSTEIFYSWIGGVVPESRRQGVASLLMDEQHKHLKGLGYKYVRTSTKNKYREMLLLNIKSGFDVTGVQKKLNEADHSIILEKEL